MKGKTIEWLDREREPKVAPNPAFPHGVDIPPAFPERAACKVLLPYPARRVGLYVISCHDCGLRVAVTTAGRPDDPRSATINCKERLQ
jgi:hypothetical protein